MEKSFCYVSKSNLFGAEQNFEQMFEPFSGNIVITSDFLFNMNKFN